MKPKRLTYEQCLERVAQKFEHAEYAMNMCRRLAETGQMDKANELAFVLAREVEHLALTTRALPTYTGDPQAEAIVAEMLEETIPIQIGFTQQGWFGVSMPMLLPKKAGGSKEYVRSLLYPVMRRFFYGKEPIIYPNCVIIYRHVYDRARPERGYRDHDSLEVKAVTDVVALYVMKDDSALRCHHYYCSTAGDSERTEIYVLHQSELPEWLAAEKTFPDSGVKLLKNYP